MSEGDGLGGLGARASGAGHAARAPPVITWTAFQGSGFKTGPGPAACESPANRSLVEISPPRLQ